MSNRFVKDPKGGFLWNRRRRFAYSRLKRIARRYGFNIYRRHIIWQTDSEFLAVQKVIEEREIVHIPYDRCYVLLEASRKTRHLPGDIAECGVRFGASTLFIAAGMGRDGDKTLHAFDSFAGLSEPGEHDVAKESQHVWESGELAVAEATFRDNLRDYAGHIEVHKGWIPERFPDVEGKRFSLVHVDVDLYEPTLDALAFFYPRTSPGGMILCDDYGSANCPGAKKAVDEFFADKPEAVLSLPTAQSLVIKQ
ncbi:MULTISPECIES: TylF/MycF/NovP-related O-methyltransferase [Limibacillus]|uniref:Macrocin-O-methyltransferase (TylF) n=1 Tax=Limibacillus halophilus TaxID=1579333 RepID=A0A839SY41_9PROT|nr:TylF/MycF/NovP-related O-methyltransferase [Limibacillus halophilus]MBB3066590.1 hypothetical protein [Limibacillus halophilus]